MDPEGNAFVVGTGFFNASADFAPTAGAFQTTITGNVGKGFISAFTASGGGVLYRSYLGGSGADSANGVVLDSTGAAYIVGTTSSTNFPTTAGAYLSGGSGTDAFVVKVAPGGATLTYSTYLGGSSNDGGQAIAVDRSGHAFVTGSTNSSNFPTVSGAFQTALGSMGFGMGSQDAFATELNAAGTGLMLSTYLGGSGSETGYGIAVDVAGYATVVGSTASTNFPTYAAFQSSNGGGTDGFVTRLTPTGTLSYSSYLGGSGTDESHAVALGPRGAAYVAGLTNSTNFPTTPGAFRATNAGGYDALLSKVLPTPDAPVVTAIGTDTGASPTDRITTSQNLRVSGTSDAGVTITLERARVLSSVGGTWTY